MAGFGDVKVSERNAEQRRPGEYRSSIVEAAKRLAKKHANSTYLLGGKTTDAFDCSYFVYLVLKDVFPNYQYMSSDAIVSSTEFDELDRASPGDVIYFPSGQVPYEVAKKNPRSFDPHVGIVIDGVSWVGRQKSSLAVVLMANPWWGSRTKRYYTYRKIYS